MGSNEPLDTALLAPEEQRHVEVDCDKTCVRSVVLMQWVKQLTGGTATEGYLRHILRMSATNHTLGLKIVTLLGTLRFHIKSQQITSLVNWRKLAAPLALTEFHVNEIASFLLTISQLHTTHWESSTNERPAQAKLPLLWNTTIEKRNI